jgi:hypothetical protein
MSNIPCFIGRKAGSEDAVLHGRPGWFYHPYGWKVAKLCILQEKRAICDHKSHYVA